MSNVRTSITKFESVMSLSQFFLETGPKGILLMDKRESYTGYPNH